jgi:outer-membrane receptor for ferric coprogen and ferric-rhodotorulic acid
VNWQSPFYGKIYNDAKGDYDIIEQQSYALVNLMTRYEYNEHLTFNLNANNVFDKSTCRAWATSTPPTTANRAA